MTSNFSAKISLNRKLVKNTSNNEHNMKNNNNNNNNNHHNYNQELTSVAQMFNGKSLFITGASGFIGRVLLVKLLGSYSQIRRIYILMRPKKGLSPEERLQRHLLNLPIFKAIRARPDGADLLAKIRVLNGDLSQDWLGLSSHDLAGLLADPTLSFVFHSAATVRFDEPLRESVRLNLVATKMVVQLCRRLPNLMSLCHVSTAYVNSDIKDGSWIEERLYPLEDEPETLIQMASLMDEPMMELLKDSLVGRRPNTYTYTKALTEKMIFHEAAGLPCAIIRPSIVVAALEEPLPGWVDNLNGPTGLILANGKGIFRTMHVRGDYKADMVPVDICINTMIAASFYVLKNHQQKHQPDINNNNHDSRPSSMIKEPLIVHCNSGDLNPVTWSRVENEVLTTIREYPSEQVFRYPGGSFKSHRYHHMISNFFFQWLPALLLDFVLGLMGKKKFAFDMYCKLNSAIDALSHFCLVNYNFETKNMLIIRNQLCLEDQKCLPMNMESLVWSNYWHDYVIGVRRYILKEKDETLADSRCHMLRVLWIERSIKLMSLLLLLFLSSLAPFVFHCYWQT